MEGARSRGIRWLRGWRWRIKKTCTAAVSSSRLWPYTGRGQWLACRRLSGRCRPAAGCGWKRTAPRCWRCPTRRRRPAPGTRRLASAPPHTPQAPGTPSAGWQSGSLRPCSWSLLEPETRPGSRWSSGWWRSRRRSRCVPSPGGCTACGPRWRSKPGRSGTARPWSRHSWRSRYNTGRWAWTPRWCHPAPIPPAGPQCAGAGLFGRSPPPRLTSLSLGHRPLQYHLQETTAHGPKSAIHFTENISSHVGKRCNNKQPILGL